MMIMGSKKQGTKSVVEAVPAMPNLPLEIIQEILFRLPVKSRCRFRSVSKSWLSLLSTPQFAKTHLDVALQSDVLYHRRQRFIFSSFKLYSVEYESICNFDSGDISAANIYHPLDWANDRDKALADATENDSVYFKVSEDEDENPVMVKVDAQSSSKVTNFVEHWVEILGSCHGLVCIAPDEDVLFLFNPCIGESKRIPEAPNASFSVNSYGFGYDSANDDYKVVLIGATASSAVSVYSLRSNCWRKIGTFPHDFFVYDSGVFLHGALHWVGNGASSDGKYVVSAFDLENELFQDMPAPDVDSSFEFVVGTLKECLCFLYSRNNMHNDFWMMREYGAGNSWTRISISLPYICMKPLCMAKNGEAVLDIDGRLVQYNFENRTCRVLEVHGMPTTDGFEVAVYLESLISPNAYSGREIQM